MNHKRRKPDVISTRLSLPTRANGQKGSDTRSGYKDSMYRASEEEIAAWQTRQKEKEQPQAKMQTETSAKPA
jgi:hypothetical protein